MIVLFYDTNGVPQPVDVSEGSVHVLLSAYRASDGTNQLIRLDEATNAILTIDHEHHEIHEGNHFFYTDKVILASSGTQDYMITTPDSTRWSHMTFMATGSAITQVDLYEATDKTGTTPQTVFNSNRNSSVVTTLIVAKGTSGGSTDGTLIWTRNSGSATNQSRSGSEATRSNEIILKQNTKYILRITSGTADNLTNLSLSWYEHTNII